MAAPIVKARRKFRDSEDVGALVELLNGAYDERFEHVREFAAFKSKVFVMLDCIQRGSDPPIDDAPGNLLPGGAKVIGITDFECQRVGFEILHGLHAVYECRDVLREAWRGEARTAARRYYARTGRTPNVPLVAEPDL